MHRKCGLARGPENLSDAGYELGNADHLREADLAVTSNVVRFLHLDRDNVDVTDEAKQARFGQFVLFIK